MKRSIKSFIGGVVLTILVTQLIIPISAAMVEKAIKVSTGINIYIDDVKLEAKDAAGNPVEPFVYNGTTYLPIRAVAESLNKAVTWEGKTSSVYLGKHDSDTPSVMLYSLDYFNSSSEPFVKSSSVKDNYGATYYDTISADRGNFNANAWEEYIINGKYSRFKGKVVLQYEDRSYSYDDNYVKIYVDDRLIYTTASMKGGSPNAEFDIDLTGVLKLKVEFVTGNDILSIVEAGLYQ